MLLMGLTLPIKILPAQGNKNKPLGNDKKTNLRLQNIDLSLHGKIQNWLWGITKRGKGREGIKSANIRNCGLTEQVQKLHSWTQSGKATIMTTLFFCRFDSRDSAWFNSDPTYETLADRKRCIMNRASQSRTPVFV